MAGGCPSTCKPARSISAPQQAGAESHAWGGIPDSWQQQEEVPGDDGGTPPFRRDAGPRLPACRELEQALRPLLPQPGEVLVLFSWILLLKGRGFIWLHRCRQWQIWLLQP